MSLRRANAALKPSLFARELLLGARRENISRATIISSFLLNAAEIFIISKFQNVSINISTVSEPTQEWSLVP